MKKPEVQKIINIICEKYPEIDTILLFGSANTPEWTPESDIDLFFIDNSLKDGRIDLKIENIDVEIQTDNFTSTAKYIKNEYGRLLNRNVSTMIATSESVRNKSTEKFNELKKLAEDALKSSVDYDKEDVKMWKYSITDYLGKAERDLRRKDTIAFYFDAHYVIQNAVELVLTRANRYFPQPKKLAELLNEIAPDFLEILQSFETTANMEEKIKFLKDISHLAV